MKNYFGFTHPSSFPLQEGQLFYWSIMKAVDSIECWCAHSSRTRQVGSFQNRGVCLQAFPSFLPHPLPTLLLVPFFARSFTLVPCFLLLNRTETLAMQAKFNKGCFGSWPLAIGHALLTVMICLSDHQTNGHWACITHCNDLLE